MATTTPNYGWAVPTSTDLVKDGATAIETLGDAIDASMNTALGTKKAGMVLLNTTSFSGVASQAFTNCFSSTYDNYLIVGGNGAGSTRNSGKLTLGATTTGYYSWSVYGRYNSATVSGDAISNGNGWVNQYQSSTNNSAMCTYLYGPNLAKNTVMTFNTAAIGTTEYAMNGGGYLADNTQYTGFTLTADSGTISGTVRVYGFNN